MEETQTSGWIQPGRNHVGTSSHDIQLVQMWIKEKIFWAKWKLCVLYNFIFFEFFESQKGHYS